MPPVWLDHKGHPFQSLPLFFWEVPHDGIHVGKLPSPGSIHFLQPCKLCLDLRSQRAVAALFEECCSPFLILLGGLIHCCKDGCPLLLVGILSTCEDAKEEKNKNGTNCANDIQSALVGKNIEHIDLGMDVKERTVLIVHLIHLKYKGICEP